MVIASISTQKANKDNSRVWVNSKILENAYVFSRRDAFTQAVIDVSPTEDWGVFSPNED